MFVEWIKVPSVQEVRNLSAFPEALSFSIPVIIIWMDSYGMYFFMSSFLYSATYLWGSFKLFQEEAVCLFSPLYEILLYK